MSKTLEEEFTETMETYGSEISLRVDMAAKMLREACDLADKHGIPFSSSISELSQSYIPSSYKSKFDKVDKKIVQAMTSIYDYELEEAYANGWRQSQLC